MGPIRGIILDPHPRVSTPSIPRWPCWDMAPWWGLEPLAGSAVFGTGSGGRQSLNMDPKRGPKWVYFGSQMGSKWAILGSKMGHFGVPNSSKAMETTHLCLVLPPHMTNMGHLAHLAIGTGNGPFWGPEIMDFRDGPKYDCTPIKHEMAHSGFLMDLIHISLHMCIWALSGVRARSPEGSNLGPLWGCPRDHPLACTRHIRIHVYALLRPFWPLPGNGPFWPFDP